MTLQIIKIHGDWKEELKYYEPNFDRSFIKKTLKEDKNFAKKELSHSIIHDTIGIKRNTRGFLDPVKMPTLEKLRELIGLENCQIIMLKYAFGEVHLIHKDFIPKYDHIDRDDVKIDESKLQLKNDNYQRILFMLEDRKPGHYMQIGKKMINKWSAGDLYIYDGKTEFHSAGNVGLEPRLVLRITGYPGKKFKEFCKKTEYHI
jgi:hypothetical protein